MKRREFVVIGLGQFGTNVAKTLASYGAAVMAVDTDDRRLELVADLVTHTVCADATNPEVVRQLGIQNYDGAIIGMGHSLEGVPFVMTKASTDLEGRILHKVGADKVIFPDKEMGYRVGNQIMNGNYFEAIELSEKYSIVDIDVPVSWIGKTLSGLNIRSRYGVNIIGIRGREEININPAPDDTLREDDVLIVLGHNTDLQELREM